MFGLTEDDIKRIDKDGVKSVIKANEQVIKNSKSKSEVERCKKEIDFLVTLLDL